MSQSERDLSLDFHSLSTRYTAASLTPTALVERLADAWQASLAKHVWIHLASKAELLAAARVLEQRKAAGEALPLYGLPFAVKDTSTLRACPPRPPCPGFSHVPTASAFVVERLLLAGALVIGKANLDQLATGLVGVRSPYGVAENPFDAERNPGGSSSGSAVAVSSRLGQLRAGHGHGRLGSRSGIFQPIWSASSRLAGCSARAAWCPPAAVWTACPYSRSPYTTPA